MHRIFARLNDGRRTAGHFSPTGFGPAHAAGTKGAVGIPDSVEALLEDWDGRSLPREPLLLWLDLESPSPDDLRWLGERFHFHPLALEDCDHFDQQPKLEEYPGHLFVVIHALDPLDPSHVHEIHCFLASGLVVTVHEGIVPGLRVLQERWVRGASPLPEKADLLLHAILDGVVDTHPVVLESIEERIDALDERLLVAGERDGRRGFSLHELHDESHALAAYRRYVFPQREVFRQLAGDRVFSLVSEEARPYFRDLKDHLERVMTGVEELRESLWMLRETVLAIAAQRTNETMRRLTVFSVVFLPLTFLTGFFGMNFEHIPWSSGQLFATVVLLILVLPAVMAFWFRGPDWR